tara:strand:+ start:305 stop:1051 length:747 start_codon:yes stop_codon:yes gene_type:complete
MKTLYVDLENGYKTLGSKESIKNMFGYQPLSFQDFSSFREFIRQLWAVQNVETEVDVDGVKIKQKIRKVVAKEGTNVECLVIDTGSEMAKQYARELKGPADALKLQQWGKLKNTLDAFFSFTNTIPASLIVNCHSKYEEDRENGVMRVMPYIEGSTKVDVGKWFDFVLYTKVNKKKDGREYVWVTGRDEHYCHAKDRSNLLDSEIPQDYSIIFDAVKKSGWGNANILIIGEPGSGKTMSLNTLNKRSN